MRNKCINNWYNITTTTNEDGYNHALATEFGYGQTDFNFTLNWKTEGLYVVVLNYVAEVKPEEEHTIETYVSTSASQGEIPGSSTVFDIDASTKYFYNGKNYVDNCDIVTLSTHINPGFEFVSWNNLSNIEFESLPSNRYEFI